MKYLKKVLFSTFFTFSLHAHAQILDQTKIDQKALVIEKKFTQDRYIKYSLTGMAVAYGIYQWMPVIISVVSSKSMPIAPSDKSCEKIQEPIDKRPLSQILTDGFQSFKVGTCDLFYTLFCTKESWLSMFQFTLSVTGANIISQISEQFIHPDTLRWYIHTYAPYQATMKLMKERLTDLQNPSIEPEQHAVSNKILLLLYDRLVRQAELMSAYMAYKVKYCDEAEKTIGEQIKIAMFKIHSQLLTDIKEQLNAAERDLTALEKLLAEYEEAIATQVNHFALAEGETSRERSFVKKLRKKS